MSEIPDTQQLKANMKKAYDDIAPFTSHGQNHLTRSPKEDHQVNVLELGCGAGVPCTQLLASKPHINVTGNDISSTQIALARETLPSSVELIEGDMMGLEFNPEQFDAVLAMYSLIHLPREEQREILRRIRTWLKPGGRFLANFSADGFLGAVDNSWLGGKEGAVFWSGWGREKTNEIMREIGFALEVDEITESVEEDSNGVGISVPFHWVQARKSS
ncbi:hypothetical protein N7470_003366 [Penicillium chermesinum]|nr:hypothetical protein N7470_003366 [Penicillium chermesinum]